MPENNPDFELLSFDRANKLASYATNASCAVVAGIRLTS
jgi:hypothetical protein